ncbi:MAG TPA: 3,4-dihydroxy-2-butanone 4-phosphate synthase, partial [Acidilobales archaeon]|nr:3,4-dihydroxy-2-butanone 4-phosphate synthase [Acidilobales archaeon]
HEVVKEVFKGNKETAKEMFLKNFQAPGHVPILVGRSLKVRKGHTELSLALAKLAKLLPSTVIVEMLDKGISLCVSKAAKIAESLRTVLIEGNELIEALGDLDV